MMGHWTEIPSRGDASQKRLARFGHTCTAVESVPGSETLVLYGGVSATRADSHEQHTALGDVAILRSHGEDWETPDVTGPLTPGPRAFHSAAAVGRMLYVFGGHVISFDPELNKKKRNFFQDMWKLDTGTWQWSLVHGEDANSPPKRDMSSLVHLGRGNLLLFGGRGEHSRTLGDCWLFETDKGTWTHVLFNNGPSPPPRKMHAMAVVNNRVMLFGGEKDVGVLDDMWALRGLDLSEPFRWTNLRVRPSPSPRFGHAIAVCGSRLVVFGGCLELSGFLYINRNYMQCRELWVLDIPTFGWMKVEDDGSSSLPSERMCHSICAFSDGRVLVMGGRGRERICADSWWLDVEAAVAPATAQAEAAAKAGLAQSNSQGSLLSSLLNPLKGAASGMNHAQEAADTREPSTAAAAEPAAPQDAGSWLRVAGGVSSNAIGKLSSAVSLDKLHSAMSSVLGDTAAGAFNSTLGAMNPAALARLTGLGYSPSRREPTADWKNAQLEKAALASALGQLRSTKFGLPATPPPSTQQPSLYITPDPIPALARLAQDLQNNAQAAPPAPPTSTNKQIDYFLSANLDTDKPSSTHTDTHPGVTAQSKHPTHLTPPVAEGTLTSQAQHPNQSAALPSQQGVAKTGAKSRLAGANAPEVAQGKKTYLSLISRESHQELVEQAQRFLCNCTPPELTISQLTVLLGDYKRLAAEAAGQQVRQQLQLCADSNTACVQLPSTACFKFAHCSLPQIKVSDVAALQKEYRRLVQQLVQ